MRPSQSWSTDNVSPQGRLRFWRDAVHASVVEMDLTPTDGSAFFSRIELCPLRRIVPHQVQGSPQRVRRDAAEIARGGKNAYYLISQPHRAWRIRHAGHDHHVQPGESVLVDSRIPYEFIFGAGLDDLSVEMPITWVGHWIADPDQLVGRPLQAREGWGLALRGVKEALIPGALAGLALPDELVEDQLGALLALASGSHIPAPPADPDLYSRCLAALRDRMAEPGLVAAEVARACRVSLRTLHRAFAAEGRTFAGALMQMRIDEAARMLADRRFRHVTIAALARRCGFLDASHFARQFRRLRHQGPREFRAARAA